MVAKKKWADLRKRKGDAVRVEETRSEAGSRL